MASSSRSYPTGRTVVYTAQATIVLNYCKNRPVSFATLLSTINVGFVGTHGFRPMTVTGSPLSGDEFQSIGIRLFGPFGAQILSGGVNGTAQWWTSVELGHDFSFPNSYDDFETEITGSPDIFATWRNDTGPDTISINVTVSVPFAEWAVEIDSPTALADAATPLAIRPASAQEGMLDLRLVPTGHLALSCTGAASSSRSYDLNTIYAIDPDIGQASFYLPETFAVEVQAGCEASNAAGSLTGAFGPDIDSSAGSLPFPAQYASLDSLTFDGIGSSVYVDSHNGASILGTGLSRRGYVVQGVGGDGDLTVLTPSLNTPIAGAFRDWAGSIYQIPVSFPGGTVATFSGSHSINDQPQPTIAPPEGYSGADSGAALLRYGASWDALQIDRAPTLLAEDFSVIGGTNGWTGSAVSAGPTYAAGVLAATGSGAGTPTLTKNLLNDFLVMLTNEATIGTWWNANALGLSADIQSWWNATGDPASAPHAGEWWKIGRKLFSASDHWNWSPWRYASVQAWADSACAATLKVSWVDIKLDFSGSPYAPVVTQTAKSASWPLALTTTPGAVQTIDLASRAGHGGLRCITQIQILFPNSKVVHLQGITLEEINRPTIDVHQPTNDLALLGVMADGKQALFVNHQDLQHAGFSVWGWPCIRLQQYTDLASHPVDRYQSSTLREIATEISLQEGFSASISGFPDHLTPNYAVFLKEVFARPLPFTLKGQRCYGGISVYPNYGASAPALQMEANLGNAVEDLVFDPVTFAPTRVQVEAEDPAPKIRAIGHSDAIGHAELPLTDEQNFYTIYAGKGTATESMASVWPISRTLSFPNQSASEVSGAGPVVLDVDELGNQYVVFVPTAGANSGIVTIARKMGIEAAWEYWPNVAGDSPWVELDETHPRGRVYTAFNLPGTSRIIVAWSEVNGTGSWRANLVSILGDDPFIRVDKALGILLLTYWRSNNIYLLRSKDVFVTTLESEITVLTGVSQQKVTFDWLQDPLRTMVAPYSDGTNILIKQSTDNGLTWT